MLRIPCPLCGVRDETEFTYGGDAAVVRPATGETDAAAWMDFVFYRDNPCGDHREYWHHALGCRQWLVVRRDTQTHRIGECRLAKAAAATPATEAKK